jgi:hypothetical protein
MWNVYEGGGEDLFQGHRRPPCRPAVSADGLTAVSGDPMGDVKIWDVESGCEIRTFSEIRSQVHAVAVSPGGDRVAATSGKGLAVWEAAAENPEALWFVGPGGPGVARAEFSPDGSRLFSTGTGDRLWSLWDAGTGRELRAAPRGSGPRAFAVAFAPDGKRGVAALSDGSLGVWELATAEERLRIPGFRTSTVSVDVSADGCTALTADPNGRIILWDLKAGKAREAVTDHEIAVEHARFLPGGERFVTCHYDEEIRVWKTDTGTELLRIRGRGQPAMGIAPLADGNRMLVSRRSNVLERLDLGWPERYDAFLPRLEEARARLGKDPRDGEALRTFGEWYAFRGRWADAADLLAKARKAGVEVSPRRLGSCYWRLRRFAEAARELRAAREASDDPERKRHLDRCLRGIRLSAERAGRFEELARGARPVRLGIWKGELKPDSPRFERGPRVAFRVEAEAGRWLVIDLRAEGFDPSSTVFFPDMNFYAFGAQGPSRERRAYMVRIPFNGTYLIWVHAADGEGIGPFTMKLYYKPKGT